jgi:hypothetical protein
VADNDNNTLSNTNSVGYKNPPVHTRFQKGKSGNPKGRPKGALNFGTTLLKMLREKVIINEKGRRREITKLEAAVMQLVNKSASGDLRALRQLIGITLSIEERAAAAQIEPTEALSELDQKVMLNILKRYDKDAREGDNNEKSNA